jgi:hypothetical protein
MQRMLKVLILFATIAVVSAPALARADSYISPFIGTNAGNNSGNGRVNVGADVGWMGAGIIGAEVDFGYAPSFFGNQGVFGSNSVSDLMGNLIVGIPAGGTRGVGVRPYATIGVGLLRTQINGATSTARSIRNNEAGMNAGVGVMGYFSDHLGIRGDVRYFRNLKDSSAANAFNIDFGGFHFWRASVGIVLRP